jgi:xanthine dehydrogenase accessory factor
MRIPTAEPDIPQAIATLAAMGKPFALAVVLADTGSTPRKAGTKALIDATGAIDGTIGGGPVEAEAQRRAVAAIDRSEPVVFDFAMQGPAVAGQNPICGGIMKILLDPTAAMHAGAFAKAAEARRDRKRGLLLTTIQPATAEASPAAEGQAAPTKVMVQFIPADAVEETSAAELPLPGAEALRSVLTGGTARLFAGQHRAPTATTAATTAASRPWVLVEPLVPPPLLVIAGGGHIGQALARQAALVGFDLLILDDRPEFTDLGLYPPGAKSRCGDVAEHLAATALDGDTYVAILTRGHQHDRAALARCVAGGAAYVGMIGSKRKVGLIHEDLLASGAATVEQLARLYAPIGLDIGAETVPEIAASIVAQLIAVRRKGAAPRMPTG